MARTNLTKEQEILLKENLSTPAARLAGILNVSIAVAFALRRKAYLAQGGKVRRYKAAYFERKPRKVYDLTPERIGLIREMFAKGWLNTEVAAFFGINKTLVSQIKTGKRYNL